MYTEEPRREINWGNLIKKGLLILFIAILIFLVIWLFTRNNSNAVNVEYEGNKVTETNKDLDSNTYSEIFITDYRYFHDTAKEYFLISNLPEKGNTLKFTLQELIDKKLILPFSYTDNDDCDTEASYVSVKNEDGKYTMTTTLVCGRETATTKEELGCNQLCASNANCNCDCDKTTDTEEKVLEYEFKQAYSAKENVYTCPTGYTKTGSGSNTKCVKTDSTTVSPTKNVEYTCPNGYTKVGTGSSATCTKGSENVESAMKNITYTCPSGYKKSGSGANSKCYKYTEDKVKAEYTYKYSCDNGYTLSNSKCYKESSDTVNATATTTYSCPSGYTLNNNTKKCTKTTTSTDTKNATSTTTYYCPSGYNKENNSCIMYLYTKISYGSTYNGCTGGEAVKVPCSTGSCTSINYVYKCTKGLSSKTTYNCNKYSGYDLSGTKCIKTTTSTDSKDATPTTTYSCSSGYTLSGTKCVKTTTSSISANKEKIYYCSDSDYDLDGKYCYKTSKKYISATKTTSYECDDGYTLSGTKCTKSSKETTKVIKDISYTCPSGYTKTGTASNAICTKGTTSTVNPTVTTKTVTKYLYKWSTQETLAGWVRTGNTRYTTASSK